MRKQQTNPFVVRTPEDIGAKEAQRLFVDVFTDFQKVRDPGHCMLNGPRGCGKSMMFRYLLPDCQSLEMRRPLKRLPFFAVLVSIKNTNLNLTELRRLSKHHATVVLNEHLLSLYVSSKAFAILANTELPSDTADVKAARIYAQEFVDRLRILGWRGRMRIPISAAPHLVFARLRRLCDDLYQEAVDYVRRLTFAPGAPSVYSGPLCGYLDFIVPALEGFRSLPFMPKGPVYLLMDDADYLNPIQTRVLNSWLSTRTANTISIKVSTQHRYKTFQTTSGSRVESPHDYSEINIADIYTASHSKYLHRITEIVGKRLAVAGIKRTPEEFFPQDELQEKEIAQIGARLRAKWKEEGRGFRARDDVHRYSRPMFIASLAGRRKATSTYSYSGFTQLAHISSGLVRFFLEPAAQMYNEQFSHDGTVPLAITPGIQDLVVHRAAEELMLTGYDKMFQEDETELEGIERLRHLDRKTKLHNLIRALGGVFHAKLVSNDAERRVFSIALSDRPTTDVSEILKLGVDLGFFHRSTIGNKDGTGRTALYVLTRRLAPYFKLDPTGFAGYLFITNQKLLDAMTDPDRFLRQVKSRGISRAFEERQLQLFE